MTQMKKNVPGGTWILLAILVVPIVWLFATQQTDDQKRKAAQLKFVAQIPQVGTVGRWHDDLGSASYGDAFITITAENGRYLATRVSGDGSRTTLALTRQGEQGNSFLVDNDKFGARYVITPAGLELHDSKGYIRTAKPAGDSAR